MGFSKIDCSIIRGGTTKGIFIESSALPDDSELRDKAILSLFGSPDHRQINGLGGGDPLTSKIVLWQKSAIEHVDIEYRSGEVAIDEARINYSTMCGNLAAATCLYAIESGLVERTSPATNVTIFNQNTGKLLTGSIPTENSELIIKDCQPIDGVIGQGVEVNLAFVDPAGAISGRLLPSGNVEDVLALGAENYRCSIVDCGTLYAFFDAHDFALTGDESPDQLDSKPGFKDTIERLREAVADYLTAECELSIAARQVKIAVFKKPDSKISDYDINAKVVNKYNTHKAYPITGALCISAAQIIPGTLLFDAARLEASFNSVVVKHPAGTLETRTEYAVSAGSVIIKNSAIKRSARILMQGTGFYA